MEPAALARFGFLTLPSYSMIACANAIEPLRMANRLKGETVYQWRLVTLDGAPATASNGLMLQPTIPLGAEDLDIVFVCGGVHVRSATTPQLASALRGLAARGISLGALCTGAFALAEAGLLQARRCAVHWENIAAIREEFPDVDFVDDLYAIDGDRLTCTGGIAPLDMMTRLIGGRLGPELAQRLSAQFIVEREREGGEAQPGAISLRLLKAHPRLEAAVRLIERDAGRTTAAEIATRVGLSARQLERLFVRHIGQTPSGFARRRRLERAKALLEQTALSVTEVAIACGFPSPAHFATTYRRAFGVSPSAQRLASGPSLADRPPAASAQG